MGEEGNGERKKGHKGELKGFRRGMSIAREQQKEWVKRGERERRRFASL